MSTRCNIIIKDGSDRFYLYHHHDGYPMGVGTELSRFLGDYFKPIGSFHPHWYGGSIATALVKGRAFYPFDKEGKHDDEYEITSGLHGDMSTAMLSTARPAPSAATKSPGTMKSTRTSASALTAFSPAATWFTFPQ